MGRASQGVPNFHIYSLPQKMGRWWNGMRLRPSSNDPEYIPKFWKVSLKFLLRIIS